MAHTELINKFEGRAIYQITVAGRIDIEGMHQFNNLSIVHTDLKNKFLSTLTGEIEDQAFLRGIINILVDNRFEVISIIKLER